MRPIRVMDRPFLDLRHVGILLNKGQFKDSGLDKITNKPHSGSVIPDHYKNGRYGEILEYVRTEAVQFSYLYEWCLRVMPHLRESLQKYLDERE